MFRLKHKNDTSPKYPVKIIPINKERKIREMMVRKKECGMKLNHENIVKFSGYSIQDDGFEGVYKLTKIKNNFFH